MEGEKGWRKREVGRRDGRGGRLRGRRDGGGRGGGGGGNVYEISTTF